MGSGGQKRRAPASAHGRRVRQREEIYTRLSLSAAGRTAQTSSAPAATIALRHVLSQIGETEISEPINRKPVIRVWCRQRSEPGINQDPSPDNGPAPPRNRRFSCHRKVCTKSFMT